MKKGHFIYTEHEDRSIRVEYNDYEVESFGGGSYEAIYDIDPENRDKLEKLLERPSEKNLKDLIAAEFGKCLDKKSFAAYLGENDIKYELFTWIDD